MSILKKSYTSEELARYLGKSRTEIDSIFRHGGSESEVIKNYLSVGKTEEQYRMDFSRKLIRISEALVQKIRNGEFNLNLREAKQYLKSRLRIKEGNNWLFFEDEIPPLELDNERLLTKGEVQDILGLSHATILKLLGSGEIPAKKVGNQWRILSKDLEEYITGKKTRTKNIITSYEYSQNSNTDMNKIDNIITVDLEFHLEPLGNRLEQLVKLSKTFMNWGFLTGYGIIKILIEQRKITKDSIENIIAVINFAQKTDIPELKVVNLDYSVSLKLKNKLDQLTEDLSLTYNFIDQGRTLRVTFDRT